MSSSSGEDNVVLGKEAHEEILARQEQERTQFKKRVERIKSSIPKKDRVRRARAAEDAAEEEKLLLESQASERLENGISMEENSVAMGQSNSTLLTTVNDDSSASKKGESKAARRRRKKAAQETDLQRRIDAEKAGMGPSPKFVEMEAIDAQLKPRNMRIHRVAADGHCLYNAIAHQMTFSNCETPVPASVDGLRNATADFMMAHKDEYMPFLETVNGDDDIFRQYCHELRNEPVWGGQVELKALAEILNTAIEVYAADLPVVRMGQSQEPKQVLRISFHRHYYGLGEHYNSVVPHI